MVEDDRYCIDILTQISADSTALERVAYEVLDDHVNHSVAHARIRRRRRRRDRDARVAEGGPALRQAEVRRAGA